MPERNKSSLYRYVIISSNGAKYGMLYVTNLHGREYAQYERNLELWFNVEGSQRLEVYGHGMVLAVSFDCKIQW